MAGARRLNGYARPPSTIIQPDAPISAKIRTIHSSRTVVGDFIAQSHLQKVSAAQGMEGAGARRCHGILGGVRHS